MILVIGVLMHTVCEIVPTAEVNVTVLFEVTVIVAVPFVLITLLHPVPLPEARFVIVIVVVPLIGSAVVEKVPVPAEETVIVVVFPVAAFGALKLYVTV